MTQEDKDLLLKDLSARLPYGVIMTNIELCETHYPLTCEDLHDAMYEEDWDDVPYLRPMDSMTEEEKEELLSLMREETKEMIELMRNDNFGVLKGKYHFNCLKELNWLLKNHFDFKGLIPKGLAIAVTKENNPYKE